MNYRVYLGGNAVNDYNVWANEAYRVKLIIWELPEDPEAEVGHDGFTVELAATDGFHDNPVDGWDLAPKKVGDVVDGGVVYWISGSDFRVVALDESQKAWAASTSYVLGSEAQSQSDRNGAAIMTLAKNYSAETSNGTTGTFATDFPAFGYCYNKTPVGTWYLPSKQELTDLYAAKGSVESVITANGGTAVSAGRYWSATEGGSNSGSGWNVNFSNGLTYYSGKATSYSVRCVRGK